MTQQPTILRNADALNEFNSANPIDFELLDDEGRQHIYILNDQSPGRTHHLVLANTSGQNLTFRKDPEIENNSKKRLPGPENHHFELRFRPGALDPAYLSWLSIGTGGWRLALKEHMDESDQLHDGTVSVYLLFVGDEELILRPNRTILLLLHHVKAGPQGGSRGSRVELRYRAVAQQLLPDHTRTSQRSFRQERLQIINNQGKKELPMIAAFEGSSTVLNNGATGNDLILQVSNLLQNATIPLNASDSESPSRFILTFDTSEEDAAWALTDPDNAAAIDLRGEFKDRGQTLWNIRPELQGNNPQWIISLRDDLSMEVGDFFFLHIEGLKTSMPSGFTTLYLLYENIPGFWDGQFEIPIEKSPLRFDDIKETNGAFLQKTNVGIGNTEPKDTLDVNGGIRADSISISGKIVSETTTIKELTIGTIKLTEEGTSKNLKVEGRLKDSTGFVIPQGGIIMWSGKVVPEGWKLCDGTDGTPDLKGRFIVGFDAGNADYNEPGNLSDGKKDEGKTGGAQTVTLGLEHIPSHNHGASVSESGRHQHSSPDIDLSRTISKYNNDSLLGGVRGSIITSTTQTTRTTSTEGAHSHTITIQHQGGGGAHENRPPYYVLAFIMKK